MAKKEFRSAARPIRVFAEPVQENQIYYQGLSFDVNELPEIKKWHPGQEYTIEVVVKQRATVAPQDKNQPLFADFDVLAVSAKGELTKDQKKVMRGMGFDVEGDDDGGGFQSDQSF